MSNDIIILGAREHNLQNIDVKIPRDLLVVITGPSGSGKSSLAFDTIYAEGQRRFVESLSAYARQFLNQNQKPDVDAIEGLSPAISIEQKSTSKNPRSTVGTLTEIHDYLRLLFARIGQCHCPQCHRPIEAQTVQQIVDQIMQLKPGCKFLLLAPIVEGRKGEYRKELEEFRRSGFARVRINGNVIELSETIELDKKRKHTIELVVDRLVLKNDIRQRLTEAVELALQQSKGLVRLQEIDGPEYLYSERFSCHHCGLSVSEPVPRLFSFNSPFGACADCDGLGTSMEVDIAKVVPDATVSLEDGAIVPWSGRFKMYYQHPLKQLLKRLGASMKNTWQELKPTVRQTILHGSERKGTTPKNQSEDQENLLLKKTFEGVVPFLKRRLREPQITERQREELEAYMTYKPCSSCQGKRLKPEALAVQIQKHSIADIAALPIGEVEAFFDKLQLNASQAEIARRILREIKERLHFLSSVGLDYLSLERSSATLSGGEAQRIRLATQMGSALQGVIYVLDEPSIGLHQRDNERLLGTLRRLRDLGNTVIVVEHDEDTIRAADHVLDMGPGAGIYGGQIICQGTPQQIIKHPESLTGAYLSGKKQIPVPKQRRLASKNSLRLKGACGNNLKNIDVTFPLGQFIAVTGVSGSGKSTLVNDTLMQALAKECMKTQCIPAPYKSLLGTSAVDKVINIDQSPIGRTPRSNPATYTQLFGAIRELFAYLPESKARGYLPGRYSFNVKGGRCGACEGDGVLRIEMHFLPDVFVTCEQCLGKRYNRETLEVLYKGKNIAEVLAMSVDEAAEFLKNIPAIYRKLETLQSVGLGYIQLGQSSTTLSGGEAQRIKLAKELSRRSTGQTVYILDEPTTGLHFHDVARLLEVLHALVDQGNTVIVIEHHLDVIKTADHLIDMGPEGGMAGGQVIAVGTPEDIAQTAASHTGRFLKPLLAK